MRRPVGATGRAASNAGSHGNVAALIDPFATMKVDASAPSVATINFFVISNTVP